jgi:hypothetical protein
VIIGGQGNGTEGSISGLLGMQLLDLMQKSKKEEGGKEKGKA